MPLLPPFLKPPARALLGALALGIAPALRGQLLRPAVTYDAGPMPLAQCHTWQVAYDDSELGRIYGTAMVDWTRQDVQVRVLSPATNGESLLTKVSFTPPTADGRMEFVMRGEVPNLHPVVAASTADIANLNAAEGAEVTVKRSESRLKAKLATREAADDTVTLTLSAEDDDDMIGHWHYRADPLTERARNGGGRVGEFVMPKPDDTGGFLGTQTGREEWTVRRPRIFYAEVLEDQVAQDRGAPRCPYPRQREKGERGAGTPSDAGRYRRILLVGSNLPIWRNPDGSTRALEPVKSERKDLTYGDPSFVEKTAPGMEPDEDVENAWGRITEGMDDAAKAAVRKLQAAIVRVDFGAGVLPGVTDFTWDGAKVSWLLQFGDNTAQVRVVRTLPDGQHWEATPVVFLPEVVNVELETAQLLPVDSISVYVAANGNYLPDPVTVTRAGGPDSRVYRSEGTLLVYNPSSDPWMRSGALIPAHTGDRIAVVAEQQRGLFYGAADTELAVYNDPSELASTWHHSLSTCARIAGKPEIDWAHLPGAQVDQYSRFFVFYWIKDGAILDTGIPFFGSTLTLGVPTKETPLDTKAIRVKTTLTLGQHAAMLMLRDLFIELMKRQLAVLQQNYIDADKVLGFGKDVAQALRLNPNSLYATLSAGTLNGKPCTLVDAVDDAALKKAFGPKEEAIRKGRLTLLRAGLDSYAAAIQKSLDEAALVKDAQREDLLKLTGRGFDLVEAQLRPRLMKFDATNQRWVPDLVARGYADSVASKQQEIEDLGAAAKVDTQLAVGVLTAAASTPVMISESLYASLLTWAANGLIWGVQSVAEVWDAHEVKKDMEFAAGASVVLGHLRYDEAQLRDTPWWKVVVSVALQGAAANIQGLDFLSKFSREMSVFRGMESLERLDGGVEAIRKLSAAAKADVQAAAIEAKALAVAGKEISPAQARALFLWDNYGAALKQGDEAISAAWAKTSALKQAISLLEPEVGVGSEAQALAAGAQPSAIEAAKEAFARRAALHEALEEVNQEIITLRTAEQPADLAKRTIASERLKDLSARDAVISSILADGHDEPSLFAAVSDAEVAWISGAQKEVDVARMTALSERYGKSWNKLKYAYEHGHVGAADQHQFVTWRKQDVDALLDSVTADTEKEMAELLGRPVKIERKAFGSTNPTSDYDISMEGPGAERVIARFNARFRAKYGLESGTMFDTNVYTDPVYKLFKSRALRGGSIELGTVEMDTVRQFSYEHMAMRKYVPDTIWAQHKELLYNATGPECRGMMDFVFHEAEDGFNRATALINKRLGGAASTADANTLLRANNDAFGEVLNDIDQWRLEMERLDGLFSKNAHYKTPPTDEFLEAFPAYRERLGQMDQLLKDPSRVTEARTLRLAMQNEVVAQMREAQGTALFFASEAYQTEGAIVHVVDELQGPLKRKVTLASLKAPPVKTSTDVLCYISSFFENRANMFKEFNHLGVFDGTAAAGEKLATKGAKYFVRDLESMKQAGSDLTKLVGDDVMATTVHIDEVRGDMKNVTAALKEANMTGKEFADKVRAASDKLAVEAVNNPQFRDLAIYLSPQFEDLNRLRALAKKK